MKQLEEILIYQDVEEYTEIPEQLRENPDDDGQPWINGATAIYYGKKKINLEKIER